MKKIITVLVVIIIGLMAYILFNKKGTKNLSVNIATSTPVENLSRDIIDSDGNKTFTFNDFHGFKKISNKFSFKYPATWNNNGQYFSPQRIEYYDLFSVRASFYFDLVLADIFDQTELKYQIDKSKRKSPDSIGKIDGMDFKRYDLIDYGSYGGSSAGNVVIYIGPKILIDNAYYYLVFHWEEKPLATAMTGNDVNIFNKIVLSLKFFQ